MQDTAPLSPQRPRPHTYFYPVRCRLFLFLLIAMAGTAQAQQAPLPAWIGAAFQGRPFTAADSTADAALYAAAPPQGLPRNRFIGTVQGRAWLTPGDTLHFVLWEDEMRALVDIQLDEVTRVTYAADLRTGTLVAAIAERDVRKALIKDLEDFIRVNRLLLPSVLKVQPVATEHRQRLLDLPCAERYVLQGQDTIRFCTADTVPSAFADAWNWLPFVESNPVMLFLKLGVVGDGLPLCMEAPWISPLLEPSAAGVRLSIAITAVVPGRQVPPMDHLRMYTVADERGEHPSPLANGAERYAALLADPLRIFGLHDGLGRLQVRTYPGGSGVGGPGSGQGTR